MMRFPLRLTAVLTKTRMAQKLRLAQGARSIQFVDAAEMLHPDSSHPVSHEKIREVISSRAPVVWIGGSEPLHHPGIAHLVRAIARGGHFVFLETDGTLLRRRIHEFQPVPRLFLTVRLESGAPRRISNSLQPNPFELAVEGIRAARLSGFSICIHVCVTPKTEINEAAELIKQCKSLDVDGIVISLAGGGLKLDSPVAETLQQKTAEARKRIGSIWWESFSVLIDPVLLGDPQTVAVISTPPVHLEHETSADEDGIKVA